MSRRKILAFASPVALAFGLAGCAAVGGGNIPSPNTPITQNEAQQGREYHSQILQEFGGAMQGNTATYVRGVGQKIAVQSGLANSEGAFTVSLLNSSVNNAFATTGGYVYTTRQLVTLMDNEAELAAVLGHEVGHVAARHAQRRQQTQQQNTLLGAAGAILSGILLGDSQLGSTLGRAALQGSQLLTLSFSRSQEEEADVLGVNYLESAGYDPRAMSTVLASLAQQSSLDAQLQGRDNASLPEWASTHPDPAGRVRDTAALAQGRTGNVLNREVFLRNIDGLTYGDDPEQGVVEGRQFIHPDLRFAFTAPQGFYLVNGTQQVTINGQSGQAELRVAQSSGSLSQFVSSAFQSLSGQGQGQAIRPQIQTTTVNGLPAAYGIGRATSGNSQVDVVVFAYDMGGNQTYYYQAITPAGRSGVFTPMFESFRRISASEAAQVVPRVIDIVTVQPGDTVASLSRRMAYDNGQEARFRVLNSLGSNEGLRAGEQVKLVVRGR
ncbi:M48 family metalloprotease [Alteriqipengyuania lutimaris]|uniref:Peptidase M48 Ste24p n=1 Tax=Alteriqipengyuania lutimaris TaxID=1538146 RepID=A0A395LMU0_9SPHN|nr:M48 family metalloprotease [Alteriqipengyuania lutimaris]MBB3032686.1 putative Zn-dependent protease [Alteriqipengyuania lutimaris]RDS78201.1 peptidase M48 Ste24p [Alteriqipengyuania lutimaris]